MIGIGIDIQSVERTKELFSNSERSLKRIFTISEIEYCNSKNDPFVYFAGRFAAKEAVVKALAPLKEEGNLVSDVEIVHLDNGAPDCVLHGKALARFNELKGERCHISISHNEGVAVAVAVLE